MEAEDELDLWKRNILNLVRAHRSECKGNCCCSLFAILQIAEKAGLEFTHVEKQLFADDGPCECG